MQTETLAQKLGFTTPVSRLREVAKRFGLVTEKDLLDEAVARGCFHYMQQIGRPPHQHVSEADFSNEELTLALLSLANPYEPWLILVGSMLLSHPANDGVKLVNPAPGGHSLSLLHK